MSAEILEQKCELFNICDCKTVMCRVSPPDESCYYYRYFKKISDSIRTIIERMKKINSKEEDSK